MKRRDFIVGCMGAAAVAGCRGLDAFLRSGPARACGPQQPNYFFSWGNQCYCRGQEKEGRDHLNEKLVFDPQTGWAATEFPNWRGDMFFLIDDAWDIPYHADTSKGTHCYGSFVMDTGRFPSFTGTPGQRLRAYTQACRECGWRGSGVWVSPQVPGEYEFDDPPREVAWETAVEDMRRKMGWLAEGEVGYLKVDWGYRQHSVAYREMMTEMKNRYYPDLVIEHAINQNPYNGVRWLREEDRTVLRYEPRLFGNAWYERELAAESEGLLKCSDAFRIYDICQKLRSAVGIERTAWMLERAERIGATPYISVEDDVCLGASLGCTFGTGRSLYWTERYRNRGKRLNEVRRARAWQRFAPAFRPTRDLPTRHSEKTLVDTCEKKGTDLAKTDLFADGVIRMMGPAVVSRGLPLPTVAPDASGEVPYVVAARYPNGALSVGAHPVAQAGKPPRTPACAIALDAALERNAPLGVFGYVKSITLGLEGRRVFARDRVSDSAPHDITSACSFDDGRVTLPGDVLNRIGREAENDCSDPGTLVWSV